VIQEKIFGAFFMNGLVEFSSRFEGVTVEKMSYMQTLCIVVF